MSAFKGRNETESPTGRIALALARGILALKGQGRQEKNSGRRGRKPGTGGLIRSLLWPESSIRREFIR